MNWLRFAAANLAVSPVSSAVNVLLMALGTASIVLLILAGEQLSSTLTRDARGVDLVLGAQGSPVQLILSSVYHADIPPGNIRLSDAQRWMDDSRVDLAAPLALGDSYRGFRIVGTTPAYLDLFDGSVGEGALWRQPLEAVLGAAVARSTGLAPGDYFHGAHGFADGGHAHDAEPYQVVGVLESQGSVIDRLVLTSLESVWELHDHDASTDDHAGDEHDEHDEQEDHDEHPSRWSADASHEIESRTVEADASAAAEITAVLLRYRTPLAAMSLPREVNADGALQAAAPAVEIARVLQLVGFGLDGLRAFAWVLVVTACLSVFAALYGSLRSRRGDLAMLRCLGATRREVFTAILAEGMLLTGLGVIAGYLIGHGAMAAVGAWLEHARGVKLADLSWVAAEAQLLVILLIAGAVSAAIPAFQAYRSDVASALAEGARGT